MRIEKTVSLAVLLTVGVVSANAASFDCAKASNKIDRMICSSARVSQLDSNMADAYRAATAAASERERLKIVQRQWLAQRDRCQDETCLISVYEQRIAALSMSALTADEPEPLLGKIEGRYETPAQSCSEMGEDGRQVPCSARGIPDCLLIRRIDDKQAYVEVRSFQINGHGCYAKGLATLRGGGLVHVATDEEGDKGKGFRIRLANHSLKIEYLEDPGFDFPPFCGARARLDRLIFPLTVKAPVTQDSSCGEYP